MSFEFTIDGLDELKRAVARSPQKVYEETQKFLIRGMAEYKKIVFRRPWRVGMSGGGAPVKTGHLRDTHITQIRPFEASLAPTADYAEVVHKGRPWLDYAEISGEQKVRELEIAMLDTIVKDLAK